MKADFSSVQNKMDIQNLKDIQSKKDIQNQKDIQNRKEFRLFVARAYSEFIQLRQNDYREAFNELLLKKTVKLRAYIENYINLAWKKGYFSKDQYKLDTVISALFTEVYDCIEDVQSEKDLYVWLYETAHILLEEIGVKEDLNDYFYQNIESFSNQEWDKMEEKHISDGNMLMLDVQHNRHTSHYGYTLDNVLIENNPKDLRGSLSKTSKVEPVENHKAMVLNNLPTAMRDVFELYTNEYLEINEIAKINKSTTEKVKELLNNARKALKVSVFNRYYC